jgi:hypothetical protein
MIIIFSLLSLIATPSEARCAAPKVRFNVQLRVASCNHLDWESLAVESAEETWKRKFPTWAPRHAPTDESNLLTVHEIRRMALGSGDSDDNFKPYEILSSSAAKQFFVANCAGYNPGAVVERLERGSCCDTLPPETKACLLHIPLLDSPVDFYCARKPFTLDGIVTTQNGYKVIVNGELFAKGDRVGNAELLAVSSSSAVFDCHGHSVKITLSK